MCLPQANSLLQAKGKNTAGAQAPIALSGPESLVLLSSVTNTEGEAEASWPTARPNKKGVGGTPFGSYSAVVSGLNSTSHQWDESPSELDFDIVAP